jgi:hypothetical protein
MYGWWSKYNQVHWNNIQLENKIVSHARSQLACPNYKRPSSYSWELASITAQIWKLEEYGMDENKVWLIV